MIQIWTSNSIHSKVWIGFNVLFASFNSCIIEVRISYFIPCFILDFSYISTPAELRSPLCTQTQLYIRWWSYIGQVWHERFVNITIPIRVFVYIHQASWYICGTHIAVILFTHDGLRSRHIYCQRQHCSTRDDNIPSWPCPYPSPLCINTTDCVTFVYETVVCLCCIICHWLLKWKIVA